MNEVKAIQKAIQVHNQEHPDKKCNIRKEKTEDVRYMRDFDKHVVIGYETNYMVTFLAFRRSPFDLSKSLLNQLSHIKTVIVYPAKDRRLNWLGYISGVETLKIYDWDGELLPSEEDWRCADSLKTLYFSSRNGYIPHSFRAFQNLEKLGLDTFQRRTLELQPWISEYPRLKQLRLLDCHIKTFPEELWEISASRPNLPIRLREKAEGNGIFLRGAVSEDETIPLLSKPKTEVDRYFRLQRMRNRGEVTPDNECKVMFLGDGASGKTSLIERIMNPEKSWNDFETKRNNTPTRGIRTTKKAVSIQQKIYTLCLTDFGGQEFMHSAHRAFLTPHAVYVIVCEARDDAQIEVEAARWLKTVKTFAKDCAVFLLLNKADLNSHVSVNRAALKEVNPDFQGYWLVSATRTPKEQYGIQEALDAIQNAVVECVVKYQNQVNTRWLGVKRELEAKNMSKYVNDKSHKDVWDYITNETYQQICKKNGIEDRQMQMDMLFWCKKLGIAYSYSAGQAETPNVLDQFLILNPNWLLGGIYRLLWNIEEGAVPTKEKIREILKTQYTEDISHEIYEVTPDGQDEPEFILQVMRKFEMSHEIPESGKELIPSAMPKTPPDSVKDFPKEYALHIRWESPYIPDNLIHRLIIRKLSDVFADETGHMRIWRTGGWFKRKFSENGQAYQWDALAEIRDTDRILDLYIAGDGDKRKYLGEFREEIQRIIQTLNLEMKEYVCYTIDSREGKVLLSDVMDALERNPENPLQISGAGYISRPKVLLESVYPDANGMIERWAKERNPESHVIEDDGAFNRETEPETIWLAIVDAFGWLPEEAQDLIRSYPMTALLLLLCAVLLLLSVPFGLQYATMANLP